MSSKCTKCGKTVYVVEKLELLNKVWHKWCFKCTVCNCTLNMKNYSATGGNVYCKTHYPMPTAHGQADVAPPVDTSAYNQGGDQTTGEAYGQSSGGGYEPQRNAYGSGNAEPQAEQQYEGGEQQYEGEQQQYYQ